MEEEEEEEEEWDALRSEWTGLCLPLCFSIQQQPRLII